MVGDFTATIGDPTDKGAARVRQTREQVLEKFAIYPKVLAFVRNKMDSKFGMLKHFTDLISIYRYMKKNEKRFGMEIRIGDMMKVARA